MKRNTKRNIYLFSNLLSWILLSTIAFLIIFNFIEVMILRVILLLVSVIGLAYFEERIFSRVVNLIVSFFLNDK